MDEVIREIWEESQQEALRYIHKLREDIGFWWERRHTSSSGHRVVSFKIKVLVQRLRLARIALKSPTKQATQ